MAQNRVLTSSEKELLRADASFKLEVRWSVLDYFAYWKGQDGTAVPGGQTANNLKKWSKIRHFIASNDLSIAASSTVVDLYIDELIKGMICWDSAVTPFVVATCIANLKDDGTVNHINRFEVMAGQWTDQQIETMPFD